MIERGIQQIRPHGVETAQIGGKRSRGFPIGVRMNAINFSSVTRGENQRLLENSLRTKLFRRPYAPVPRKKTPSPAPRPVLSENSGRRGQFPCLESRAPKKTCGSAKKTDSPPQNSDHQYKIKHAQTRSPRPAPGRRARQPEIDGIKNQHKQRKEVLGIQIGRMFRQVALYGQEP